MLTGSELKIIYGEGSPLVTQPEQHWTQADRQTYVDRCFYYDISMEPALDGGRFWKWTMQAGESSPTYGWVHVTDGDTLAALEKISNVASDGVLTGGGEKTRVYLEWMEAVKTYSTLLAQMQENNADGDWTNPNSSAEYKTGVKFFTAWSNFGTAFFALATYLNNKTDFSSDYQVTPPSWINDSNRGTSTVLPPWLDTETPPGKAEWTTGAKAYRGVWQDYYDTMIEMRRALDAWQFKKIDEMGDDGLIDPVEKATLRQLFNEEVIAYWKRFDQVSDMLLTKIPSTEGVYTTLSNADTAMQNAIQQLGSYLCGKTPTERHAGQGDWYIATPLPWTPQNSMRNGLQDPPESGTAPTNLYPTWLQKGNDTQATVVDDNVWDYFWAEYTKAKQNLIDAIAAGNDYLIENATADILPQVFIQASAPTDYKEGDHWYQPTTLTNPVTGATVSQDQNGNPIYNHYVAKKVENVLKWVLVNAATTSVFSQLANQIYQAVFDSTNASSLVMRANSIESTVSKISEGSQNLLINSHFEYGTDHWAAYNSATISVVEQSGLPGIFAHCLKVQTSSGAIRGMQFSTTQQPYILLEEGKTYTFSFWAKADASKRIYVYRGTSNLGFFTIGTDWDRYGYSIEGDGKSLTFYIRDYNASDAVTFYLVGLQLECGPRSDWQDFGGEPVMMKSQILQLADKISMGVFKDEARKAGIDIEYDAQTDSGTVTLDGDKVIVEGDLDVKGLTTENVTIVERNHSVPTIINMGIVSENDNNPVKIKSVQVKAVNIAGTAGATGVAETEYGGDFSHMVVLPFYDSLVGSGSGWPASGDNLISFNTSGMESSNPLYGNFALHADTNVDPSQRRVVQWKQNGTHLTITNEVDYYCQNFKEIENGGYDNNARSAISRYLLNRAVLVVADPRIVCQQNTVYVQGRTTEPYIGGYRVYAHRGITAQGNDIKGHAGCLSCGGYNARFCVLLPGQTLKLRSQLMTLENHTVLTWVVENPTDFDVMYHAASSQDRRRMTLCFSRGCTTDNDVVGIYANNVAFDPYATPEAVKDAIIGSKEANYYDNNSYYCLDF